MAERIPDDESTDVSQGGDDALSFATESTEREGAGRAFLHILVGLLIFGTATAGYVWYARQSHAAQTLVIEANEQALLADVPSLRTAEARLNEALQIQSGNEYALSAMAEVQSLLWVLHRIDAAKPAAEQYAAQASAAGIERAERYAAEALVAYGNGNLDAALGVISGVLEKGGVSEKLYWLLGLIQQAKGQPRKGRDNLRRAQDSASGAPHYGIALGDAYDDDGDRRNANLYWQLASKDNSNYIPAAARELLVRIRKGESAKSILPDLVRLESLPADDKGKYDEATIAYARAEMHYFAGQTDKALAAIEQAVKLDGETARRLQLKGRALLASKQTAVGLETVAAARALAPSSEKHFYGLADAYREHGRVPKALELLESGKGNYGKDPRWHTALGNAHRDKGDFEAATKAYDAALALNDKHADTLLNYGIALRKQKNPDKATEWFEKAINARRTFPEVYEAIGLMWIEQGAASDGNVQLEQAEKLYRTRGVGALELRRFYTTAIKTLQAARGGTNLAKFWQQRHKALNEG